MEVRKAHQLIYFNFSIVLKFLNTRLITSNHTTQSNNNQVVQQILALHFFSILLIDCKITHFQRNKQTNCNFFNPKPYEL